MSMGLADRLTSALSIEICEYRNTHFMDQFTSLIVLCIYILILLYITTACVCIVITY